MLSVTLILHSRVDIFCLQYVVFKDFHVYIYQKYTSKHHGKYVLRLSDMSDLSFKGNTVIIKAINNIVVTKRYKDVVCCLVRSSLRDELDIVRVWCSATCNIFAVN